MDRDSNVFIISDFLNRLYIYNAKNGLKIGQM